MAPFLEGPSQTTTGQTIKYGSQTVPLKNKTIGSYLQKFHNFLGASKNVLLETAKNRFLLIFLDRRKNVVVTKIFSDLRTFFSFAFYFVNVKVTSFYAAT